MGSRHWSENREGTAASVHFVESEKHLCRNSRVFGHYPTSRTLRKSSRSAQMLGGRRGCGPDDEFWIGRRIVCGVSVFIAPSEREDIDFLTEAGDAPGSRPNVS